MVKIVSMLCTQISTYSKVSGSNLSLRQADWTGNALQLSYSTPGRSMDSFRQVIQARGMAQMVVVLQCCWRTAPNSEDSTTLLTGIFCNHVSNYQPYYCWYTSISLNHIVGISRLLLLVQSSSRINSQNIRTMTPRTP